MRKVSCDLGGDYFENEEWQGSDTAILIRNRKRAARCLQIKTSIGKRSLLKSTFCWNNCFFSDFCKAVDCCGKHSYYMKL